jgi:hypothetical protein
LDSPQAKLAFVLEVNEWIPLVYGHVLLSVLGYISKEKNELYMFGLVSIKAVKCLECNIIKIIGTP